MLIRLIELNKLKLSWRVTAMTVEELIKWLKEFPQDKRVFDVTNVEIDEITEDDDGVYLE